MYVQCRHPIEHTIPGQEFLHDSKAARGKRSESIHRLIYVLLDILCSLNYLPCWRFDKPVDALNSLADFWLRLCWDSGSGESARWGPPFTDSRTDIVVSWLRLLNEISRRLSSRSCIKFYSPYKVARPVNENRGVYRACDRNSGV